MIFTIIGIFVIACIACVISLIIWNFLWENWIESIYRWYFKNEILVIEKIKKHTDCSNQFTEVLSSIFSSLTPDYKYYYRKRTKNDKKIIFK